MPTHVHLLASAIQDNAIEKILMSVKGFTARELNQMRNRTGHVWNREFQDRIVRNESEYREKWKYIFENAIKVGLVEAGEEYIGFWQLEHLDN